MNLIKFFIAVFALVTLVIFLQSCNSQKKLGSLVYFNQPGDTLVAKMIQSSEPTVQAGDKLSIIVNAANAASAAPYNLLTATATGGASAGGGYIVENDGTIQFPQLGKIKVVGLKRKQLVDLLSEKLLKFVNDPIVTIEFLNFKITVLGEVGRPGTINIPDGKVTMLDAIGLVGDLPTTARRDNILVMREKNGEREFGHINMLSKNAFSSPYFLLKQNDVVYVEMNSEKISATDQATFTRNFSLVTSVLSVITTLTLLVVNATK